MSRTLEPRAYHRAPLAPTEASQAALSVVVVTHDSAEALGRSLPPLVAQLRPGDELIVCDNASQDGTVEIVRGLAPSAIVLEPRENLGFAAGCNLGAARASSPLLLLLNPDVVIGPGFREAIELPLTEGRGWSAWQGLVTDGGGTLLNTTGGVVHFTGIAWAGGAGGRRSEGPAEPREIAFASGACLAIRAEVWDQLGGFAADYFLYHEDTDLGLRLWLAGHRVGIEPRAVCDHEYEFAKGSRKWLYLERNRWATIVRTYPASLLLSLLPALMATELALVLVAARGGWLREKLAAWRESAAWTPRLLRERRAIQASAGLDAGSFARACLTPDLDSEYLGAARRSRLLGAVLRGYWAAVGRLL